MSTSTQQEIAEIIATLQLQPHPEGGYFREIYRCSETIAKDCLPSRYAGARSVSTSIYYMLTSETFSVMHRVASDEIYHFYSGSPLELLLLHPGGRSEVIMIGPDIRDGQHPQFVIPHGVWQGSRVYAGGSYCLIGATVAPGFDFADFEEGKRADLVNQFPAQSEMITALTRK